MGTAQFQHFGEWWRLGKWWKKQSLQHDSRARNAAIHLWHGGYLPPKIQEKNLKCVDRACSMNAPKFWGTWYTAPLKGCKINEVIFCLGWSKKNCFGWPLVAVDIGVKLDVFTMQLFELDNFESYAVFSLEKMGSKWSWNSPWRQGVSHPNQFRILFGRFFCGLGQNMSITACPGGHAGIFCDLCDKETWVTFRPRGDEGERWS